MINKQEINNFEPKLTLKAANNVFQDNNHKLLQSINQGLAILEICHKPDDKVDATFFFIDQYLNNIFNTNNNELMDKHISDYFFDKDVQKIVDIINTEELVSFETYSAQLQKYFHISACSDNGKLSVLFSDVTKQRKLEEDLFAYHEELIAQNEELKETIEKLSLTEFSVEKCSMGIVWFNPDGSIFNVNELFCEMTGFIKKELFQMNITDIYPDYNNDNWNKLWNKIIKEKSLSFESQLINKDNKIIPTEINTKHLCIEDQEFIVTFVRDITNHKEYLNEIETKTKELLDQEEKLIEQNSLLQEKESLLLIQNRELKNTIEKLALTEFSIEKASLGIFWVKPDGNIFNVNEYGCEITGYSKEELYNMNVINLDQTLNSPQIWKEMWDELEKEGTTTIESQIKRKDGSIFPMEVTQKYLYQEDKEFLVGFIIDISSRKQYLNELETKTKQLQEKEELLTAQNEELEATNEELEMYKIVLEDSIERVETSEKKYASLFHNMSEGVIIADMVYNHQGTPIDFRFIDVNPAYTTISGIKEEQTVGKLASTLFTQEVFDKYFPYVCQVVEEQKPIEFQLQSPLTGKFEQYRIFPYEKTKFMVVFSDITKMVIAENELKDTIKEQNEKEERFINYINKTKKTLSNYTNIFHTINEGLMSAKLLYNITGDPIDFKILDINPSYEKIAGITRDESIGSLGSTLHGTNEHPYFDAFVEVDKTGEPLSFEITFLSTDHLYRCDVFSTEKSKFIVCIKDVTKYNQNEKAYLEQNKMLEDINTELEESRFQLQENIAYLESLFDRFV